MNVGYIPGNNCSKDRETHHPLCRWCVFLSGGIGGYGAAFDDFNREWQGADTRDSGVSGTTDNTVDTISDSGVYEGAVTAPEQKKTFPPPTEYRKLSLEERARLLPPPSDDRMEELKNYQDRMGYTEESMRSMRYKMSVYDDFTEEYDYRVKYAN